MQLSEPNSGPERTRSRGHSFSTPQIVKATAESNMSVSKPGLRTILENKNTDQKQIIKDLLVNIMQNSSAA